LKFTYFLIKGIMFYGGKGPKLDPKVKDRRIAILPKRGI
jgi:hypothetical protein